MPGVTTELGRLTFRTVYGGPDAGIAFAGPATRLRALTRDLRFAYDYDLFLHIGGEISTADGPSGVHAPRVSVAKRTVTAQIRVHRDDAAAAADPEALLRHTIHIAMEQLIHRTASKDRSVDEATELAKLDGLVATAGDL